MKTLAVLLFATSYHVCGFGVVPARRKLLVPTALFSESPEVITGELTPPEQRAFDVLKDLHDSGNRFRIVVAGNGAILESSHLLGPQMKLQKSPKTGTNLVTLASTTQDFEFHVQLNDVSKIVFTTKDSPVSADMMRIVRFLNVEGNAMASMILADEDPEWWSEMIAEYGEEIQL